MPTVLPDTEQVRKLATAAEGADELRHAVTALTAYTEHLERLLAQAANHLDFCSYGDMWEADTARRTNLPARLSRWCSLYNEHDRSRSGVIHLANGGTAVPGSLVRVGGGAVHQVVAAGIDATHASRVQTACGREITFTGAEVEHEPVTCRVCQRFLTA